MRLKKDMCMSVNISLQNETGTAYGANTYVIKPEGAVRLHRTEQVIFRT